MIFLSALIIINNLIHTIIIFRTMNTILNQILDVTLQTIEFNLFQNLANYFISLF